MASFSIPDSPTSGEDQPPPTMRQRLDDTVEDLDEDFGDHQPSLYSPLWNPREIGWGFDPIPRTYPIAPDSPGGTNSMSSQEDGVLPIRPIMQGTNDPQATPATTSTEQENVASAEEVSLPTESAPPGVLPESEGATNDDAIQDVGDPIAEQVAAVAQEATEAAVAQEATEAAVAQEATDAAVAQEATDAAVAQETADAAVAADQTAAQNHIDEQTRFLRNMFLNNPDNFRALVNAGVIDDEILDQINSMNDDQAQADNAAQANPNDGANDGDGGDTVAQTDGDDQEGADGATDQATPAVNDGNNNPAVNDGNNNPDGNANANANPNANANANAGPNTDHFIWVADRRDAQNENEICPACQVEFAPDESLVYLDCGHKWCKDCLNLNYRAALSSRKQYPPKCCECDVPLEHESIQTFLDKDIVIQLVTKMAEYTDPDPVYCQTPKCTGGYIRRERISGQWAGCDTCLKLTCVECKAAAAEHPEPKKHPKKLADLDEELATKEGWKLCPGCKNLVERTEGCDFMQCECGHHFCYKCGGTLMNNMPCVCQGTPQWVQDMNNEAAGVAGNDGAAAGADGNDLEEREVEERQEEREEEREEGEDDG